MSVQTALVRALLNATNMADMNRAMVMAEGLRQLAWYEQHPEGLPNSAHHWTQLLASICALVYLLYLICTFVIL